MRCARVAYLTCVDEAAICRVDTYTDIAMDIVSMRTFSNAAASTPSPSIIIPSVSPKPDPSHFLQPLVSHRHHFLHPFHPPSSRLEAIVTDFKTDFTITEIKN
ncbi:hypothetical protein C0Q70_19336 [Pomacea canaliculata]|uniref:Uncharacterized protein n=1 Tax=Pomacea canaliculata TaxID=400727 RepID=A0A2T7NJ18_POMCA|nr:hypothetical protein C0Q70_19336 [Pomacea canaliculata]